MGDRLGSERSRWMRRDGFRFGAKSFISTPGPVKLGWFSQPIALKTQTPGVQNMRWQMGRQSDNVEEDSSSGGGSGVVAGGGIGVVVLALIAMALGVDPSVVLNTATAPQPQTHNVRRASTPSTAEATQLKKFVSVVLGDTEDVWREQFQQMGRSYVDPKLRLFRGSVDSACGFAKAAMGPFYCPADRKVYIDLLWG
jgi:uncharacterized protein